MAGLVNYVNVEIDDLYLNIEKHIAFKMEHAILSSTLFTAINQSLPFISSRRRENLSLHECQQRHSIGRTQNLFRDKFLEIIISIGPISLVQLISENETRDMVVLPCRTYIDISCHLSAGCVSLKVEVNIIIESI